MGMIRAWFPSLRSTEHHMGAWSIYSFFVHFMHSTGGIKYPLVYLDAFIVISSCKIVVSVRETVLI